MVNYLELTKKILSNYTLIKSRNNVINILLKTDPKSCNHHIVKEIVNILNIANKQELKQEFELNQEVLNLIDNIIITLNKKEIKYIELKYIDKMINAEIMKKLHICGGGFFKHQSKLLSKISFILFGI